MRALLHKGALPAVVHVEHVDWRRLQAVVTRALDPGQPCLCLRCRDSQRRMLMENWLAAIDLTLDLAGAAGRARRGPPLWHCHLDDLRGIWRRNVSRESRRLWYYVTAILSPCCLARLPALTLCSSVPQTAHGATAQPHSDITCACWNLTNTTRSAPLLVFHNSLALFIGPCGPRCRLRAPHAGDLHGQGCE